MPPCLNHLPELPQSEYWPLRSVVAPIVEALVRERGARKERKRLRVFLAQSFCHREAVDVDARSSLRCLRGAGEYLQRRRGDSNKEEGGSPYLIFSFQYDSSHAFTGCNGLFLVTI